MPVRWIINPVIETTSNGTTYRRPHVSTLIDPGHTGPLGEPKTYEHTSVIADGVAWCLSKVVGVNFAGLDADCVDLFEGDYANGGARTVSELGWNPAKLTRVRGRLEARGVDTSSYAGATPLWRIALDLAKAIAPGMTREALAQYRIRGA